MSKLFKMNPYVDPAHWDFWLDYDYPRPPFEIHNIDPMIHSMDSIMFASRKKLVMFRPLPLSERTAKPEKKAARTRQRKARRINRRK